MEKNFPSYIYDHVFRPVVLTVTTPEAEALIKKHDGLSIAKYLNMHSSINERVRIRLPGSADTERQGFEIVFATPDTLLTPFTNKLHAALVEVPPCQPRASIVVRHKGDAVTYQREYTRTLRSSEEVRLPWSWWYQIWREHRLACSVASEYETAHHPVAVLVCVTRQQLSATSKVWDVRRPPSYWPKYMDSNLPVHYCLVSDSDVDTAVQLEECKKATGSNNCHVITVGSLNEVDIHRTQEFTRELMLKNIIPDMERGIKTTHDQMQTERKGFSHKWKLWMGGKFSKDEGSDEERYPPASVEQQQRKMGDWAMMLGDWQFAVIHLKQLADVFRADGAVLHRVHALHSTAVALLCNSVPPVTLVQGQQTITVLLSNQIAAQLESLLDAAYRELLKLLATPLTPARAQLLQALAQRILLLHADVLLVSEVPDAVQAGALFDRLLTGNQSGTDPLAPLSTAPLAAPSLEEHSAWLERALYLEQLALCHLATRPSAMIRKFAFRMFQAGLVYHHLALALAQGATTALVERYYQHALRCFSSSYHVLECHEAAEWSGSSAWSSMLDHAHSLLARLSHRLGLTQHAFTLFARLVQHNQQSATAQASLLREFFHLMRASHVPDSEVTLHFPLLVDINLNDEQLSSQWQSANSLQRLRALKRDKKRQSATKHTASRPQYLRFVVHDDPIERNNSPQAEQLLAEWHWMKMEEALIVSEMSGDKAQLLALKKQQVQYQQQNTRLAVTVPPLAVVHEPFWVELKLFNPLQVPLQLFDLHLLIDFQSTEVDEPKIDNTPFNLLLQPQQRHMVRFALRAKHEGRVTVHGIRFRLVPGVWCVVRLKSPDSKFTEQNSLNMLKRRKFNKSSNNLRRSEDDSEDDNVSLNGSSSPQLKNSLTSPVKRKQSHKRSSSHQDSGNVTPTSSSPRSPSLLSEDNKVSDDHVITVVGVMPRLQVCLVGFNDDVTAKNSSVSDVLRHGAKNSTVFMAQYQPDAESNAELNNVNPNQVVPRDHKITVRGGLIKRLLLNIVNTGHAPIKKICFTHSHPNLFLIPRGEDLELLGDNGDKLTAVIETKKVNVSHVTRPPTTPQWLSPAQQHIYYQLLATCSHTPLHVTRISLAEILQPGQSLSLPIYYRSPTNLPPVPQLDNVLQHKFLFLAESPKSATTKFRLQKCQVDVKVLPSLRVTSHTRPSHDHLHNHIWSIEFENGSKDSTVVLHELVALSAQWTLTPLSNTHSARLPPQSSLNLFFHVQPRDTTATRHSGPWGEDSTVISFDRSDLDEREIQRAFMNKEKAEQHEVEREQQASASGFKPAPLIIVDNAQHELELAAQRRMVSVQSSYNVQLLITWTSQNSTKSRAERGQHHLIDVKFTPNLTPALQPTDLSKQCPLRFVIDSPAVLTHDFARQSLALVPIVFHVTNTSPLASLEYEFETLRPQETVETSNELNSSSDYLWSGTTHRALTTLAPLQSAQFNVTACFARPGRYLINRFKFNVYATDPFTQKKKKLTLYSSSQHLLVIK